MSKIHELHHKLYTPTPVHIYAIVVPSLQPQHLHPQARLQWKRCADIPVEMENAQAVVLGEKIYVGGGETRENHVVFQYDLPRDGWSRLPPHPVRYFAMAQFRGHLITVGGKGAQRGVDITGKVYLFKEESQVWVEFLKPMPTARYQLSAATTQSFIIASGGVTGEVDGKDVLCPTVEVYSIETFQWYTAAPLPAPYAFRSSVTIADGCYLLGGHVKDYLDMTTILYASLTSIIAKATSPIATHQSASNTSVWKILPVTPLKGSAAASLSGNLIAVGGYKGSTSKPALAVRLLAIRAGASIPVQPTLHTFLPFTNSWVKITNGVLPEPRLSCTAVQLSPNTVIVIGGADRQGNLTKTVFTGTLTV